MGNFDLHLGLGLGLLGSAIIIRKVCKSIGIGLNSVSVKVAAKFSRSKSRPDWILFK